jgi:hypothetical protein
MEGGITFTRDRKAKYMVTREVEIEVFMLKDCGQLLVDNDCGNVAVVDVIVGERDEINRQRT